MGLRQISFQFFSEMAKNRVTVSATGCAKKRIFRSASDRLSKWHFVVAWSEVDCFTVLYIRHTVTSQEIFFQAIFALVFFIFCQLVPSTMTQVHPVVSTLHKYHSNEIILRLQLMYMSKKLEKPRSSKPKMGYTKARPSVIGHFWLLNGCSKCADSTYSS